MKVEKLVFNIENVVSSAGVMNCYIASIGIKNMTIISVA